MGENVKRFANDRNPNGLGYSNGVVEDERGHYVLHSDYEALARQAEALQRENAELREALKPFASVANYFSHLGDEYGSVMVNICLGSLRRARALLGGENAE